MEDTIKLIATYGGLAILAGLFVLDWLDNKKNVKDEKEKNNKVMQELANSNNNIAESLNLLKTSLDSQNIEFRQHDERAINEFANIKQELIKIRR